MSTFYKTKGTGLALGSARHCRWNSADALLACVRRRDREGQTIGTGNDGLSDNGLARSGGIGERGTAWMWRR